MNSDNMNQFFTDDKKQFPFRKELSSKQLSEIRSSYDSYEDDSSIDSMRVESIGVEVSPVISIKNLYKGSSDTNRNLPYAHMRSTSKKGVASRRFSDSLSHCEHSHMSKLPMEASCMRRVAGSTCLRVEGISSTFRDFLLLLGI